MKRILITGMNKAQCTKDFYLAQQLNVVPSHYSLIRALEDMGFDVEQRPVGLGEDISHYDHVVVYIHSIQAFCQYLWSGLYALSQRPDAIIAFDDWQLNQILDTIHNYHDALKENDPKVYRQYLFDLWSGPEDKETVMKYQAQYLEGCDVVTRHSNKLLVSAFAGGDVSKLKLPWDVDRVFTFNPNPYHLNRTPDNGFGTGTVSLDSFFGDEPEKKREWNFASLVQNKTKKWLKEQNHHTWTWPINYYGAKRGEHKSERKTEPDMCRVYHEQWGCLMPGYFHAGSGWWRARPLQVADAGSILVCDDAEGAVFGDAYVGIRAENVELMSDKELHQLAKDQHDCLYDNHPLDKKIEREELQRVLDA